jgi:hypothetical protein
MAQVERKLKSNSVTQHVFQHDGNILFRVPGVGEAVLRVGDVSLENRHKAMLEGFVKRIINMAAISRNTDTGASATPAEKWARMQAAIEHYNSGSLMWAMKVASSAPDDAGLVVQALMRVKSCTIEQANSLVEAMMAKHTLERKDVLANLRKNPAIVKAMGDIRAEHAAANKATNAADFLAEMDELSADPEDESVESAEESADEPEEAPF